MYHKLFRFNFYIAHWQHVDLLCSSLEIKKLSIHLLLYLICPNIYEELLW